MTKSSIVSRSVIVLDIICSSRTRLSFVKIAQKCGFPKSSTHRILSILREEGLVALDPLRNLYRPGPKLLSLATGALNAADLADIAGPILQELSSEATLSAAIGVLDEGHVLWLQFIDNPSRHRTAPRVGDRTPAHVCATGKALLAFSNSLQQQSIMEMMEFEVFTHRTITDPETFQTELKKIRAAGIATSNREEFLQDVGIAAPVFDHNGDVVASIGMFDMTGRLSLKDLLLHQSKLLGAASFISAQLGFQNTTKDDTDDTQLLQS